MERRKPKAVFMAFGTKGDVYPLAAIAAAFACDQRQYHVILITHSAHKSLCPHLAEKHVQYCPVSSPPVLSTDQNNDIEGKAESSFLLQKTKITRDHRRECFSLIESIFGDSPSLDGDLIVINFFALEGWNLAESFSIRCVVAAPYVVPYSAPATFESQFQRDLPLLYKYLIEAPSDKVCWKDVIHWMWPLFTENWGSWRNDDLHLSPCPFTDPVTGIPTWHTRMETRIDNLEVRFNRLERGLENLLEMAQSINQTLQQKGNSSGDSENDIEGNLEGQNRNKNGPMEERWRRLEIPIFSGEDAYGWVNRVERYFNLKGVMEQERLQAAMVAMEGKALTWFQWWEFSTISTTWEEFRKAVIRRFQPSMTQNPYELLLGLKQSSSGEDFKAAVIRKFQPEFDLDICVQEEGSESWEQNNKGKNEALKFKNQLGSEEAIHIEVEQVKETNIKMVVAEKERETELELHVRTVMEVQEANVADKIEKERKWDAVKENNFLGLMGQTQLIQVVHLRTKVHLEIHVELFNKFQIVAGSVLQPMRFLCKTFKQKLEAGLGEAFKASWLQEDLRGVSFDPGGTWLSAATSYSP